MIFSADKYCSPSDVFEASGEVPVLFGTNGGLGVALVSSGQCSLEGPAPVVAPAGSFVLTSAPLALLPTRHSHVIGVVLNGTAAAEAAASLGGPLVVDGQSCPHGPELLYQLLAGKSSLSAPQASALAYALLCQLAEGGPAQQNILPPLVAAAMEEMHEHYAEVYGIEELAGELGVSKSHLVRIFSAAVGVPPGRYLTLVRLDAAKRLLLHREYTLETIANLCGFAGANYFCRVFKKETGQTPAAWRLATAPHALPTPERTEREEQLFL